MMPMATGPDVMTAEELLELPSGRWRYELVRGQLRVMTLAGHVHGRISARIAGRLFAFVEANRLGVTYAAETGFMLSRAPDTVRAPDAAFVSSARLSAILVPSLSYLQGAPDLAVEVMSPSDRPARVVEKTKEWLAAGCRAVVVLDPATASAIVHRPGVAMERFESDAELSVPELLPGWSVAMRDIFQFSIS
jgi:Uma2 family endonuclease